MIQILKEMCYTKLDKFTCQDIRAISGRRGYNTATEQAKAKDVNMMTVIKEPTEFDYFT